MSARFSHIGTQAPLCVCIPFASPWPLGLALTLAPGFLFVTCLVCAQHACTLQRFPVVHPFYISPITGLGGRRCSWGHRLQALVPVPRCPRPTAYPIEDLQI